MWMPIDMKELARRGAQLRLAELVAEMDSILDAFPDLGKVTPHLARPTTGRRLSEETRAKMRAAWAGVGARMKNNLEPKFRPQPPLRRRSVRCQQRPEHESARLRKSDGGLRRPGRNARDSSERSTVRRMPEPPSIKASFRISRGTARPAAR